MTNPYYNAAPAPVDFTVAKAAPVRAQFSAIQSAFDKISRSQEMHVFDFDLPQYFTEQGSVGGGTVNFEARRTAGFGSYGINLFRYDVTAPTPAGQFDCNVTGWMSHRNLTGGQAFGAWFGANTPSLINGQPYTAGGVIGLEINAGNRYGDEGFKSTIGSGRYTVGIQVVPDILPAPDAAPTAIIYPGTFGIVIHKSIRDHKWWTGMMVGYESIMPGGAGLLLNGGGNLAGAPASIMDARGFYTRGLDFTTASFTDAVFKFASGQVSGSASAGPGQAPPGFVRGYLVINVDGTLQKIPYFNV